MSTKRGILKSLLATIGTLFIAAFATGSHASIVSAGGGHSCAVVNGGVQCWGFNGSGQLGNNSIAAQSLVPVQAIAPGSNATVVSAGGDHTCAVVNGGVQCWGLNVTGQLGNNSTTLSLVPVQAIAALSNVTAVSAGGFHSCAVVNGGVQCWGQNGGKLGNNSTAQSLVPVQAIAALSNVTAVSAGGEHSCAVVNGGVQCWGQNTNGPLGNNSTTNSLVPVQAVAALSNATAVSAGSAHSCAVVNGGVQCWGLSATGQLGNNSTTQSLVPVQTIAALGNVTAVEAGSGHSCAVVNGGVQCWGDNSVGQLGNNSTTQSLVPVQTIAALSNVTAVGAGASHSCAAVNGGLQCWGNNTNGHLGNNSTTQSLVPVAVLITTVPGAPTAVTAVAGISSAVINYTPPASDGGTPIFTYTATANPGGITGNATGGPILVTGLTNGTAYTFTVTATNAVGVGPPSAASNSVTPMLAGSVCVFNQTSGAWTTPANWNNCGTGNGVPLGTPGPADRAEINAGTAILPAGTFNVGDIYMVNGTIQGAGIGSTNLNIVAGGTIAGGSGTYTFQNLAVTIAAPVPMFAISGPWVMNSATMNLLVGTTLNLADLTITGAGARFNNGGFFFPSGTLTPTTGGVFENTSAGVFVPAAPMTISGTFVNNGAFLTNSPHPITLTNAAGFSQPASTGFIGGDGTLSAVGQTLTIAAGFIEGDATFNVGTLNNTGAVVSPGGVATIGVITVNGNYTVNALGGLDIEIAAGSPSTVFDQLTVTGSTTITGSSVDFFYFDDGFGTYVPAISDAHNFLVTGTRTGTFAAFTAPMSANAVSLAYFVNGVDFVVTAAAPAVTVTGTTTFPNTVVATLSGVQPITITNSGTGTLTLSLITASNVNLFFDTTSGPAPNAAHWCGFGSAVGGAPNTGAPINIAPGGTCVINVVFRPNAIGGLSSSIIINSNAPTSPTTITLNGTGLAAAGPTMTVAFAPTNVAPGANSTMTLTLTTPDASPAFISGGSITIPVGLVATPPGSNSCGTFGSVSEGVYSFGMGFIPAMGSCTIALTVQSPTPGTYTANIAAGALSAGAGMNTNTSTSTLIVAVPAPVITSPLTASGTVGTPFTYNTVATNTPTSFNATGLPAGLSVNATNGVISGTPTGAGTSIVTLSATNAGGTGTATLTLAVTAAPAPAVTLTPPTINFGTRTINTTSPPSAVTLTNSGTANLVISSITGSGDFGFTSTCPISTPPVIPTGTCAINITFTPLTAAALVGTITITSNAPGSPHTIALSGTGSAVAVPGISLSPTAVSFGAQAINTASLVQSVIVTNTGFANLLISTITVGAPFSRVPLGIVTPPDCGVSVAPSSSCQIGVNFTPTVIGAASGLISITDNASGSPHTVPLSGTGTAVAVPVIAASSVVAFGDQVVNTTGTVQNIIRNTGSGSLNISAITLTGPDAARFTLTGQSGCTSIAPLASCTLTVTFTPTLTGPRTAQINITSDAQNAALVNTQALTGNGILAPRAVVNVTSTAIGFGNVIFGGATPSQAVTLTNTGGQVMNISSIVVTGDFVRSSDCGTSLASLASCTVSISFTPLGQGSRFGELTLNTNAATSPDRIPLSGTGCRWFSQTQSRFFLTSC